MGDDTEGNLNGWTVHTLHVHIARMIAEHDKRYEQRFLAQENAVQSALTAQEKAVNAARGAAPLRAHSPMIPDAAGKRAGRRYDGY